jgi:hypothetical protein
MSKQAEPITNCIGEIDKGCIWKDNLCGVLETGEVYEIIFRKGEFRTVLSSKYKVENKEIVKVGE